MNEFVNGETVNWSLRVNGPAKRSKRIEPELVINMAGLEFSVLLV